MRAAKAAQKKAETELEKRKQKNHFLKTTGRDEEKVKAFEDHKSNVKNSNPNSALNPVGFDATLYASMLENLTDMSVSLTSYHGVDET